MEGYDLISQSNYAKKTGKTRATINYHVRKGNLDTELVDGVPYILIPKDEPLPEPPPKSKSRN